MPRSQVTSYDVAQRARVSQSTVSRALRDDPRVLAATRERVRAVAAAMGYVPHVTARSLITRRSSSIAVVAGDLANPSYPRLIRALQAVFAEHDYRVLLLSDAGETAGARDVEALRGGLVDGVVFISARLDSPVVAEMVQWGIPLVVLNRDVAASDAARVDRVTSDNATGGALVAAHLHALGHRRAGVVSGPLDHPSVRAREAGFLRWWDERGAPVAEELVVRGPVEPRTGFEGGCALLALDDPPTALFCATDYVAMGTLDAAARRGASVPGDVSVVGYNDLEQAGWSMFDLTTVRQPLDDMAASAARMLLARIAGDDAPARHERFDVSLVVRGSTGPPASGNTRVT